MEKYLITRKQEVKGTGCRNTIFHKNLFSYPMLRPLENWLWQELQNSCSCKSPEFRLGGHCSRHFRPSPPLLMEYPVIPFFPDHPGDEGCDGIETMPSCLAQPLSAIAEPEVEGGFVHRQRTFCPMALSAIHHSWRDFGQATRRWSMLSLHWSQRTQRSGCGSLRLRSRSPVQHLLSATNQIKYWHRGGARDFQNGADWNRVLPKNSAW